MEYELSQYRSLTQPGVRNSKTYKGSFFRTSLLLLLYAVGTIIGFVALVTLVKEAWPALPLLQHLSEGAIGLFVALAAIGFLLGACVFLESWFGSGLFGAAMMAVIIFCAGAVIYSDWALAVIADNIVGVPDGNNVRITIVYWTYFAAKVGLYVITYIAFGDVVGLASLTPGRDYRCCRAEVRSDGRPSVSGSRALGLDRRR